MARPRGIIDTRNPVEWKHPLNRGLVSWWLPFGPWRGGGTLRDLARRNDGTLTNFTLSSAWVPGRDGFGAVQFDGSNDHVLAPASNVARVTVATLFRVTSNPASTQRLCGWILNGPGNSFHDKELLLSNTGMLGWYIFDGGAKRVNSATAVNLGEWTLAVGTCDGSTMRLYQDGAEVASAVAGNSFTGYGNPQFMIGGANDNAGTGAGTWFSGGVSATWRYDRPLSASEVASLYDQTQRGYPDTIRRYSSARWFVGTAGGGGGVEGTASGTVGVTCAASGSVGVTGTGAGTVGVTAAASGAVAVGGTASGTVGVTCSASGSPSIGGTGSGSVAVSVSAAGTVAVSGTGAGTVGVSAAASGSVAVSGTASGDVSVTLASAGTVAISGTASGTVNVTVFAQDSATTSGTAAGTVAVTCSASGSVSITGTGAGEVGFTVASTAAVSITGTAAGLVGITCAASDAVAPTGDTNIYVFTLF